MPPQLLFVYGTLHPDHAPAEVAAEVRRFVLVGQGTVCGALSEAAGYPALRVGPGIETRVPGTVFEVPGDRELWARLDRYEDFRPQDPEASLYLRKLLPVTLADCREVECWVYVSNEP